MRYYSIICPICYVTRLDCHPNTDMAYRGWLKCSICAYTVFQEPNKIPYLVEKPLPKFKYYSKNKL